MSKGSHTARTLQQLTGRRYTTCLARIRDFRDSLERDTYMVRVAALPSLRTGQLRCLTCLQDAHAGECQPVAVPRGPR